MPDDQDSAPPPTSRKDLNSYETLERVWSELWDNKEDWLSSSCTIRGGESRTIIQNPVAFRARSGGAFTLGLRPRMWIVLDALMDGTGKNSFNPSHRAQKLAELKARHEAACETDLAQPSLALGVTDFTKYARAISLEDDPTAARVNSPTFDKVRALLAWGLADLRGQTVYTPEALFDLNDKRFTGRDALDHFRNFVTGGGASAPTPMFFVVGDQTDRQKALKDTLKLVERTDPAAPMLINVHAPGLWRDGAAMAQAIAATLDPRGEGASSEPRFGRIVLSRYAQTQAQNPPENGANYCDRLSFDHVLSALAKLFLEPVHCEKLLYRYTDNLDPAPLIHEMRVAMSKRPHRILFEGFYERNSAGAHTDGKEPPGTETLRIVLDDHLLRLVHRLVEPFSPESTSDAGEALETFRKNRFVIFSNEPLRYFKSQDQGGEVAVTQVRLPSPDRATFARILPRSALTHREAMRVWLDQPINAGASTYEPLYDLLDRHLGLVLGTDATEGEQSDAITDALSSGRTTTTKEERLDLLMQSYLEKLKVGHAGLRQLHLLLALTPGGLRPITLRRICRRMRADEGGTNPLAALADDPGSVLSELSTAPGLLSDRHDDPFHPLDAEPPVFESALLGDDEWATSTASAIDFHDPILKESVLRLLLDDADPLLDAPSVRLIHRHLMEEGLSQQTLAMRNRGPDHPPGIRAFRRLMSVIHHGLCSLPLVLEDKNLRIDDTMAPSRNRYFAAPHKPSELYVWIYSFLYRRVLERAPAWDLSREFALDQLKADLLSLFAEPRVLPGHPGPKPRGGATVSLIESVFRETHPRIVRDYLVNKAHAETALGDAEGLGVTMAALSTFDAQMASYQRGLHIEGHKDHLNKSIALGDYDPDADLTALIDSVEAFRAGTDTSCDLSATEPGWIAHAAQPTHPKFTDLSTGFRGSVTDISQAYFDTYLRGAPLGDLGSLPYLRDLARDVVSHIGPRELGAVSNTCHALYRISELIATEADLFRAKDELGKLATGNGHIKQVRAKIVGRFATMPFPPKVLSGQKPYFRFCVSLVLYKLAEHMRMEVFRRDPLGNFFFHSGHAARACMRTALILEREARKTRISAVALGAHDSTPPDLRLGLFAREARRINDRVTRHLFRYPRERASLQILESSFTRMLSEPRTAGRKDDLVAADIPFQLAALNVARRQLVTAEGILIGQSRRNRVRLRLSLERSKLYQARAKALAAQNARSNAEEIKTCLDLAAQDAKAIQSQANATNLSTWMVIAEMQVKRVEALKKR